MEWLVLLAALGLLFYNLDSINISISFWKKPDNLLKTIDVKEVEKRAVDKLPGQNQ